MVQITDLSPAHTESFWQTPAQADFAPLARDLTVDVAIIGGGIAGLTSAYLLTKQGKSVAVLEARALGGTMTLRTTAHLVTALDDRLVQLQKWHGRKNTKLAAQAHASAIDQVEQIVAELDQDCDFKRVPGYLVSHRGKAGESSLRKEMVAARESGLTANLIDQWPGNDQFKGPALAFTDQAQIDIGRYQQALLIWLQAHRVPLFGQTAVTQVNAGFLGRGSVTVHTEQGASVKAKDVIVATNAPINSRFELPLKQEPYISYVIAARFPADSLPPFLLWDDLSAYHYVRLARSRLNGPYDTLIVGGEDHKVGQADDADQRYEKLEKWMRKHYPQAGEVTHRWEGQVLEPIDGLGFMGHSPFHGRHVYVITGDSGNGMTHGTLGAMIVTDLIQGKRNPYARLFDPKRRNPRALPDLMKAGMNVQLQYVDLITPGEVSDEQNIPAGEGAIMRHGLHKIAVYRDEAGQVHRCSAVCPHLAALVRWNSDDKTWDCPCHGSRFDAYGKVFQGPAYMDLASVEK